MIPSMKLILVTVVCVELVLLAETSHSASVPSTAEHGAITHQQLYSMIQQLNNSLIVSVNTLIAELQAASMRHVDSEYDVHYYYYY